MVCERKIAFAGEHYGKPEIDVKHEIGFFAPRASLCSDAIPDVFRAGRISRPKNPQRGTAFVLRQRLGRAARTRIGLRIFRVCGLLFRSQNYHGRGMIACERTHWKVDSHSTGAAATLTCGSD
jgi:hypothetical protein